MKQHSFKQNYPWLLLLVWLYSCQQQDEIPMIEPIDNGHLIVSAADVPQVVYELQQSLRFKQEGKLFGINDGEQSLNLEIDWEQIYQLIDEQGKETYTFRIADGDGDFATFYNLVMKFSENGDPYTPFLMKYTMSEAYAQAFLETGGGASFEGSVQRILLSKPASTTASTANLEDPFGGSGVDTNPCPGEIPIGGGNTGGTDPSNVGDNCQMMLVTTTWYSQVCDPSGCGAPTVVDITQSLEFVCDSDGATAAWSETECDPVDEKIPILEPVNKPCPKDPVPTVEVAAQKNSGIKGGMFGKTRSGGTKQHNGLDIKNDFGSPVYAMYSGTVYSAKYQAGGAGYNTRIQSTVDGKTFLTAYFHLQKDRRVTSGSVSAGDIIGYQGDSGNLKGAIADGSTVSHLHIEVREHDGSNQWGYSNYKAVDPRPYLSTTIDDNGNATAADCN